MSAESSIACSAIILAKNFCFKVRDNGEFCYCVFGNLLRFFVILLNLYGLIRKLSSTFS